MPRVNQDQINKLIKCIVNDKMTITEAAKEAGMHIYTGRSYYKKYVEDPEHKIPLSMPTSNRCTQQQINKIISYIVNNNMTILDAAEKTNMDMDSANCYYDIYVNDPEHKIPMAIAILSRPKGYSREEIQQFIYYILNDNMSVPEACKDGAPETYEYTHESIKQFIDLIDMHTKISLKEAANEIGMCHCMVQKYYDAYLEYFESANKLKKFTETN